MSTSVLAAVGSGGIVGFMLGLLAGGGSILATPLLLYVVGVAQPHVAIGTGALAVSVNAFVNFASHAFKGHVWWRCAAVFSALGVIGALAGSSLGKAMDGDRLIFLFGILMVIVGVLMLRPRKALTAECRPVDLRMCLSTAAVALAAGAASGFFGIGGGFLIVPGLMLATGMPMINAIGNLSGLVDAEKPRLDGLLSLKGVIDVSEDEETEEAKTAAEAAVTAGFAQALKGLSEMRRHEGEAIGKVLFARLDEMAVLAERAERAPGRQPEAVKKRLADQIAVLLDASSRFDADRLHQEAILMAGKADIREELDRLAAHIAQARKLMTGGGAVGRRLDFLSQELNRETNTLCSKSNDIELTNIGLELKSVVEQFREQVQNLE